VVRAFASAIVLALLAAACSSAPAAQSTPATRVAAPTSVAATPTAAPAATGPTGTSNVPVAAAASYLGMTLTDVRTGERFTLGGSAGKTVIVEGMAVW